MALLKFTRKIPEHFNTTYNVCLVRFSSEYRVKTKKVHNEIGFESKPDITTIDCDYIGPPDKVSNLRPVLRHVPLDETQIEKQLRLKRIEVEGWNQHFWVNHNQKFFKEKQAFIKANQVTNEDTLSADKMSEFYKSFLDSNWKSHFDYNRDWYKKNFEILLLSYRTKFQFKRWFKKENNDKD